MKRPPQDFVNAMSELKIEINWQDWKNSMEWKCFKSGYNSAVRVANQKITGMYDVPKTAERCFR